MKKGIELTAYTRTNLHSNIGRTSWWY